jgi:hypothetical protein
MLYFGGASYHSRHVNTAIDEGDQIEYIHFSKKAQLSNYTYMGGRNRMPIYPFLQSIINDTSLATEEYFLRGKLINICLSMILLAAIFMLIKICVGVRPAICLTLTYGFWVFIFKAGYFQPECLFYALNAFCFIGMLRLINKPSLGMAIAIGLLLGIAHLTKASILPAMGLFTVFFLGNALSTYKWHKSFLFKGVLPVLAVWICFLIVILPYIKQNKQIYGHYFYNVSTNFAMWSDSLAEYQAGPRAHGDRHGWPDMPDSEIPSMAKYLREHSYIDITYRLLKYGKGVIKECLTSYGYQYFVLLYLFWICMAIKMRFKEFWKWARSYPWLLSFVGSYFATYFLLYAWYGPIELGNRLILSQFLPFCFVLFKGIHGLNWKVEKFYIAHISLWLILAYPTARLLLTTQASN